MKHEDDHAELTPQVLAGVLRAERITTTDREIDLLLGHARLVLEANQAMNLTRLTSPGAVMHLHIADSLAWLQYLEPLREPVVDLGSGAGYPGIPIAITGTRVCLCESVKKKAEFLSGCIAELGISARVAPVRAEELACSEPGGFGTVIARAVTSLPALVELAAPLLRIGGTLIALKGTPSESEIISGDAAGSICGMSRATLRHYSLARGEQRTVITYEKRSGSRVALPRRSGMAQRAPLA